MIFLAKKSGFPKTIEALILPSFYSGFAWV